MHQQLFNHVSEETAYIVQQFPYTCGVNTRARYWVETKPAYGQRVMYQYQDPISGKWFKAKTNGYFDICILEMDVSDTPARGLVVMHEIKMKPMDLSVIGQLAGYYEFSPFQQEQIMRFMGLKGDYRKPAFRPTPSINIRLALRVEAKPVMVAMRAATEDGIPTESQYDADRRVARERRANYPSEQQRTQAPAPTVPVADIDSIDNMTPMQKAMFDDLMKDSN